MIVDVKDYIQSKSDLFCDFDEYLPQMEKIEKANSVCNKLFDRINASLENFNEEAFDQINIEEIVEKLGISLDTDITTENLVDIYREIENSFALQGRVSLTEYIYQGNLIYVGLQNDLLRNIDYSIAYSEEELKKKEKEAFERFAMLSSMKNMIEIRDAFDLSKEASAMLDRSDGLLAKLVKTPVVESVEEHISDLAYTLMGLEELSMLQSSPKDIVSINEIITEKISNVVSAVSEYINDENIHSLYMDLNEVVDNLNNKASTFSDVYQETYKKLESINELMKNYESKTQISF